MLLPSGRSKASPVVRRALALTLRSKRGDELVFGHLGAAGDISLLRTRVELLFRQLVEVARAGSPVAAVVCDRSLRKSGEIRALFSDASEGVDQALPQVWHCHERGKSGEEGELPQPV